MKSKRKRIKRLPGYPAYPINEDIYIQNKQETEIDPENITEHKALNDDPDAPNEKNYLETGDDLDVPGSELDDEGEFVGSEDEENNYYSIRDNK